jgi:hypothetical protein
MIMRYRLHVTQNVRVGRDRGLHLARIDLKNGLAIHAVVWLSTSRCSSAAKTADAPAPRWGAARVVYGCTTHHIYLCQEPLVHQ